MCRDIGSDLSTFDVIHWAPVSCWCCLPFRPLSSSLSIYLATFPVYIVCYDSERCRTALYFYLLKYICTIALHILFPILFDISGFEWEMWSSGHLLFNQILLCSLHAGLFRELILAASSRQSFAECTSNILTSTPLSPGPVSCSVWPWVALCLQMPPRLPAAGRGRVRDSELGFIASLSSYKQTICMAIPQFAV